MNLSAGESFTNPLGLERENPTNATDVYGTDHSKQGGLLLDILVVIRFVSDLKKYTQDARHADDDADDDVGVGDDGVPVRTAGH